MTGQLSKADIKRIASLDDAKGRRRSGLFVAEGSKCVLDLARTFTVHTLIAEPAWLEGHPEVRAREYVAAAAATMNAITRLTTRPPVIALFDLPNPKAAPAAELVTREAVVVLDRIQDPGNLGTILRTCDWMGIRRVVASPDTVDAFNPKVVQATMGALAQVEVAYTELPAWLDGLADGTPVYGTFLGGEDIYDTDFAAGGVIVMGNEGRGISPEVEARVSRRITIPAAPGACAESLNVATATAMVLSLREKSLRNKKN